MKSNEQKAVGPTGKADRDNPRDANCRLAACAPEMLEALEAIVNTIARHNVPVASYLRRDEEKARAVIARAKGVSE